MFFWGVAMYIYNTPHTCKEAPYPSPPFPFPPKSPTNHQVLTLWRRGTLVLWRQPGILRAMFGREVR